MATDPKQTAIPTLPLIPVFDAAGVVQLTKTLKLAKTRKKLG